MRQLNRNKSFDSVHGHDEQGRRFAQIQDGERVYFDSQGREIDAMPLAGQPAAMPAARRQPRRNAEGGKVNMPKIDKPMIGPTASNEEIGAGEWSEREPEREEGQGGLFEEINDEQLRAQLEL